MVWLIPSSMVPGPNCNLPLGFTAFCHTPQAHSQVTKLQTRLDSNLLKRLEQLQATAAQPELAGQRASLAALSADLARAESALADVEGRLTAVEARSEELSKEVRDVVLLILCFFASVETGFKQICTFYRLEDLRGWCDCEGEGCSCFR